MTDTITAKDDGMAGPPPVADVGPIIIGDMPPPPPPALESGARLAHRYPNPQKHTAPAARHQGHKKCRRACYTLAFLVVAAAAYLGYAYFENQWPLEHGFCLRKDCGHGAGRGVPEVGTNARPLDNAPDAGTGGNGLRAGGADADGGSEAEAPLVEPGTVFEFGVDLTADDADAEASEAAAPPLAPAPAPALASASGGGATTLNLLDRRLNVDRLHVAGSVLSAANPALASGAVGGAGALAYNPKPLPPPRFAHLDFSVTALEVDSDRALMLLTLSEKNDPAVLRLGGLLGARLFYEETREGGIGEAWGPEGQGDDATEALRALLQFTSGNQDFATELEDGEEAAEELERDEQQAAAGMDKAGAKLRLRSERVVRSGAHKGLRVTAVRERLSALGGLVNTRVTVASGDGRRARTVDARAVRTFKLGAGALKATVAAAFEQRGLFRARQAAKLKAEGLASAFEKDVVGPASSHAALLNGGHGRMLFPGGHCGACKKTCRRKWYCLWLCKVCTKRKSCTRQFAAMKSTCYFVYESLKGMDCANWSQDGPTPCPGTSTVSWGSWFTCFFVGVEVDGGGNPNPGGSLEMFKHASGWVGNPPRLHEYRSC